MDNMFNFSGKTVVITGASSGLGIQHAKLFASQGADIAIVARRYDRLLSLSEEIEKMGVQCLPIKCDVTSEEDIQAALKQVYERYGKIDILINNAGLAKATQAEETNKADWDAVLDVNLTGVFLFAKNAAIYMKEQSQGRIINISSVYGKNVDQCTPIASYYSSKAAVIHLTKSLATEWAKYGITVNAIGPGLFESEMTTRLLQNKPFETSFKVRCPMARPGKEGELDTAILFLCSDHSGYVTGQTIYVDGGLC